MSIAIYPAMLFTVALLVTTAYFLMGGLPLLVLDHDTSLDARFIRGFFNIYYKAAFVASIGAAISFAFLGRPSFAVGAVAIASLVVFLRSKLLPAMDHLSTQIQAAGSSAVKKFRQVHSAALLVNLLQLVLLVWALLQFSL
jgi:hypothetical protein